MGHREIKFKNWDGSQYVPLEVARRMTLEAVETSTEKSRDEGVKNLANSSQWFELLPDVIEPEKADRPVRVISPEEYLELAIGASGGKDGAASHDALVVDGDFELVKKRATLLLLSGGVERARRTLSIVQTLPSAVIRGDLRITDIKGLREIHCNVTGDTALQNCPDLTNVQGECFGSARFSECGMSSLAAGYRCAGDLRLLHCKNLRVVNCEVGGSLTVSSSPLERTGAALQVGGDLYVMGNGGDVEIRGRVGGRALHAGVELPVRGLPKPTQAASSSAVRPPVMTRE